MKNKNFKKKEDEEEKKKEEEENFPHSNDRQLEHKHSNVLSTKTIGFPSKIFFSIG